MGASNLFFVIGNTIATALLTNNSLPISTFRHLLTFKTNFKNGQYNIPTYLKHIGKSFRFLPFRYYITAHLKLDRKTPH